MLNAFRSFLLIGLFLVGLSGEAAPSRQLTIVRNNGKFTLRNAISQAQPGDTLRLTPGKYFGPVVINKPLVLTGVQGAVIDGRGKGSVIHISAPHVTVRELTIRNSGLSLATEDAGITVESPYADIEQNRFERVLFGVYLKKSHHTIVRNNYISGDKNLAIPRRGDLIRAWYSNNLIIENNIVDFGRDVIIWFSKSSVIRHNRIRGARYGLHFMYSDDCQIENNMLLNNSVGLYMMFSRRLNVRHNTIAYNRGPSGFGVGIKDFDDGLLEANLIVDNRIGIFIDNSPREIDSRMTYRHNLIAFNDIGVNMLALVRRNDFSGNTFQENYEQVGVIGGGQTIGINWRKNYWSDYAGFDQNRDGFGDIPYRSQKLFESLMDRKPAFQLFKFSPALQAISFATRTFPVMNPIEKLKDDKPLISPYIPAGNPNPVRRTRWPLATSTGFLFFVGLLLMGHRGKLKANSKESEKSPENLARQKKNEKEMKGGPVMIAVTDLHKNFGKHQVLSKVSFTLDQSEAVALWGSNGAGKTTILRCLLGLLPYSGKITIQDIDVRSDGKAGRRLIGFVPQNITLHENMSVRETLLFYARLKKLGNAPVETWLERLDLKIHARKKVDELSGGMKQRLALAVALLADPPILLLDEPTANLDLESRDSFMQLLKELNAGGKTILFSSHRLEEVISFASRVLVLDQGVLKANVPPEEVYSSLGKRALLRLFIAAHQVSEALGILQKNGFTAVRNGKGLKVRVEAHSKGGPISLLAASGVPVKNFEYEITNES